MRRARTARDRSRTAASSAPRWPTPPLTPVGARYSPNTSRSAPAHSPVVPPAWARAMVAGMRFSSLVGRHRDAARRARRAPRRCRASPRHVAHVGAQLRLFGRVHLQDRRGAVVGRLEGRRLGLGEGVDAHHEEVAGLDAPHPLGLAADQAALQLVDRLEGTAELEHVVELRSRRLDELGGLGLDHRASPRRCRRTRAGRSRRPGSAGSATTTAGPTVGAAQGLVPRRQLDGPGPGVARQRDAQRFEHDAGDVVLGLGLGQAERVDLDAVAEPTQLGVLDAVALQADAVPHPRRGHAPCTSLRRSGCRR